MNINKTQVDYVIRDKDIDEVYRDLGFQWSQYLFDEQVKFHAKNNLPPPPMAASGDPIDFGKRLWSKFQIKLTDTLCDSKSGKPKEKFNEIIEGEYRELIVAIITAIATTLETPIAIATPLAALCLKNGLKAFCSEKK